MEQEDKPCLHCIIQAEANSIGHVCVLFPLAPLFQSLSGGSWCGVLLQKTDTRTWPWHGAVIYSSTPVFPEMPPSTGETWASSVQNPFLSTSGQCGPCCAELWEQWGSKCSWRAGPGGGKWLRNKILFPALFWASLLVPVVKMVVTRIYCSHVFITQSSMM